MEHYVNFDLTIGYFKILSFLTTCLFIRLTRYKMLIFFRNKNNMYWNRVREIWTVKNDVKYNRNFMLTMRLTSRCVSRLCVCKCSVWWWNTRWVCLCESSAHILRCVCTCVCAYVYVCLCESLANILRCVCVYVHMCVCVYVCICVCVCANAECVEEHKVCDLFPKEIWVLLLQDSFLLSSSRLKVNSVG